MVDDWFYYVNGDVRVKSIFGFRFNFKNNVNRYLGKFKFRKFLLIRIKIKIMLFFFKNILILCDENN